MAEMSRDNWIRLAIHNLLRDLSATPPETDEDRYRKAEQRMANVISVLVEDKELPLRPGMADRLLAATKWRPRNAPR